MIIGLGISTPEITLQKDAGKPGAFSLLREGQVVKAKVLGMLTPSTAQLLISGQKVTAETQLPLTPGQEIQLQLIKDKNLLTFKMLASPPTQPSGNREGLSLARLAGAFFALEKLGKDPGPVLRPILQELALKSGQRDDGFLGRLLKDSGMLLEKKIATLVLTQDRAAADTGMQQLSRQDLKAAVLQLLSGEADSFPGGSGRTGDKALAREIASALDSFQALNSQPSEQPRFILPFPVLAGDQFNFGQLLIDTGKKEDSQGRDREDRIVRLAFLLNMTALGNVRADFSVLKKTLAGRFLMEDQASRDYMASLIPDLEQRLLRTGFQMGVVDCQVAETGQLSVGALIQTVTAGKAVHGLDLVV